MVILVQKIKIVNLSLKCGIWTTSNMQDSMMLNFFAFDWKYYFCANLVQKIKDVYLN